MSKPEKKIKKEFDKAADKQPDHVCEDCGAAVTLPHLCPKTGLEWVRVSPSQRGM